MCFYFFGACKYVDAKWLCLSSWSKLNAEVFCFIFLFFLTLFLWSKNRSGGFLAPVRRFLSVGCPITFFVRERPAVVSFSWKHPSKVGFVCIAQFTKILSKWLPLRVCQSCHYRKMLLACPQCHSKYNKPVRHGKAAAPNY